jgi:SAM-dependent methyltransferase
MAEVDWVQGAGEHLPIASRSIDQAVVFGNVVCFATVDGPRLLGELGRVARHGARLLVDFASPAAATQEFFQIAAELRWLPRILRTPDRYFLDRILSSGFQPYAPSRMAYWEFQFYTVEQARRELARAGFRVIDTMSIAPIAAFQDHVAKTAHREPRTWEALLRIEERIGRRPGVREAGHGFAMAAVRK